MFEKQRYYLTSERTAHLLEMGLELLATVGSYLSWYRRHIA